ncbi:hypothetical protein [Paraburkholderia sp. RL18-085-BIA-A]|uniref:hypothetical protein n=1 Tax=Paraburkholderia sp. RL18-085-BIA-A TaxID=3031633 RepID=UPI0038BB17E2
MSMMSKAIHESAVSSKKAGGSFATQQNRRFDTTGLLRFARQVGELHSSISEIPAWVVHAYAQYCAAQRRAKRQARWQIYSRLFESPRAMPVGTLMTSAAIRNFNWFGE